MKTKKFVIPLAGIILVLIIVLAACGAKPGSATGQTNNPAANGTLGAANFSTRPLPLAEQLLVGTFKLSGTSNALSASQASALVPLWQAYAQLTSSNTAAQAEIDAVVTQIQSTMSPQQVQTITAMKLTRQDLFTTMSSLGLSNGFGNNASGTPEFRGTPRAGANGGGGGFFPGGGGGGGGFPGGGGGGVPGTGGTGSTRPTPNPTQIALRAQFANRIPTPLMNALIAMLQKTAGT